MSDLAKRLRTMADAVQPVICLGDEDSIFLTPKQIGYQEGLRQAASMLEETASPAAPGEVAWEVRFFGIDGQPSEWRPSEPPPKGENPMVRIVEYRAIRQIEGR